MSSNPGNGNGNGGFAIPGASGQLPPSASSSSSKMSARTLSCALCQRRKIKCDRTVPCSNCIKANVVCTPSKPAPPRQRTRPRQDLQERLARCENLLRQYADADRPLPHDLVSPKATTASGSSTPNTGVGSGSGHAPGPGPSGLSVRTLPQSGYQNQNTQGERPQRSAVSTPGGRMVQESSIVEGARFVDGQLWERLNDEISNMKHIIESEEPDVSISTYDNQRDFEDASNCPSPSTDEKPNLDPVQAFKLWQVFLDRVNPLIKIIHAPTLQPFLVQAAADISSVPLDYQALLFSIFGLATISLTDEEAASIIGCTKEQATHRFTKSTFYALTRFDFLRRYNMVVLQALVHNLVILQSQYNRHASWVLSGSLVRIAISMGYHRDGEKLGLPPFETEMRRRIWWQIVNYDLKLTVDCGFRHQTFAAEFDTKQPLNLNDADLYPDASGELKSREGPTEMAFMLVSHRLTEFMLDEKSRLTVESTILGQGTPELPLGQDTMERNRRLVQTLEQDLLEIERRFLSPTAGNAHVAALGFRPHLINRLNDTMRPMTEAPEWGTEIFEAKDNIFKLLLCTSENIADAYKHMKEWGFGWFVRLHFHLEIMASLSSFMYQRPMCNFTDRGWRVFDAFYREFPELHNLSQRAYITQAQFTLKAWDAREQAYHNSGSMLQVPEFIMQLRQMVQQHTTPSASSTGPRPMGAGQGDVQMQSMHPEPLSFMAEEQMGSNSVHSSFLTWDFMGNAGAMGGMADMGGMGTDGFEGLFGGDGGQNPFP